MVQVMQILKQTESLNIFKVLEKKILPFFKKKKKVQGNPEITKNFLRLSKYGEVLGKQKIMR